MYTKTTEKKIGLISVSTTEGEVFNYDSEAREHIQLVAAELGLGSDSSEVLRAPYIAGITDIEGQSGKSAIQTDANQLPPVGSIVFRKTTVSIGGHVLKISTEVGFRQTNPGIPGGRYFRTDCVM